MITLNRASIEALAVAQLPGVASEEFCDLITWLWQNWVVSDVYQPSSLDSSVARGLRASWWVHSCLMGISQHNSCWSIRQWMEEAQPWDHMAEPEKQWGCLVQSGIFLHFSDKVEENYISSTRWQLRFPGSASYFYNAIKPVIFLDLWSLKHLEMSFPCFSTRRYFKTTLEDACFSSAKLSTCSTPE